MSAGACGSEEAGSLPPEAWPPSAHSLASRGARSPAAFRPRPSRLPPAAWPAGARTLRSCSAVTLVLGFLGNVLFSGV